MSKKSRHLGFSVRVSWAAAISIMQIRYGPSRGSWLEANGVGGGKVVTPKVGPSRWLWPGQTLNIVYMVLRNYKAYVYEAKLFL